MHSQNSRPQWWQVYLTLPLLIVLFFAENRLKISTRGHQIVQIGILLLVFGLVHVWINANSSALSQMDRDQYRGTYRVIVIPPFSSPDAAEKPPLLQFSDSEVKGMLSNTFEFDYVDAQSMPAGDVSQDIKKE